MDEAILDLEIPVIDISHIVTEDDEPVDNLFSAKQQRLLVRTLYVGWKPGIPFLADANIGLFNIPSEPPLVPDFFLSMGVQVAENWYDRAHRTYFFWEFGKAPEIALEIVSNRKGGERAKMTRYAAMGIDYYIIWDAEQLVMPRPLTVFERWRATYRESAGPLLETVGLGLTQWQGEFEQKEALWLRWTDLEGNLILLGSEQAALERERTAAADARADQEKARAELLAARLRELGIDPDSL